MTFYIQIWEFDYGNRESVVRALDLVNEFDKDTLTGMTIYWSDIPYDLRLFSELAFTVESPTAREKAIEAQEIMAAAGGKVRTDITPDRLVDAMSMRRLNMVGTLPGMPVSVPFAQPSKAELESKGYDFSSWVAESRVFLSHQHERKTQVTELQQLLANEDIPTWFDIHDIEYGQNLAVAIEDGVKMSNAVIFWISDGFLKSNWCRSEFESFLSRYMGRRDVVIFAAVERDCVEIIPDSIKQLKYLEIDNPGDPVGVSGEFASPIRDALNSRVREPSSGYWTVNG